MTNRAIEYGSWEHEKSVRAANGKTVPSKGQYHKALNAKQIADLVKGWSRGRSN